MSIETEKENRETEHGETEIKSIYTMMNRCTIYTIFCFFDKMYHIYNIQLFTS